MRGRIGSGRRARIVLCLSALLLFPLWQSSAAAIELPPPPLEDLKEKIKDKIEDIKDKLPPPPEGSDLEQQIRDSGSEIQGQIQGIGDSGQGDQSQSQDQSRSQGSESRSRRSESRSQQADSGDLEDLVGAGQGIGGTATGGLSFFCTRGEALCYALPIAPPAVKQPKLGGGLEFTGLDLQRAIAVFFIFAGAGTILLAWDARSRAALIDH